MLVCQGSMLDVVQNRLYFCIPGLKYNEYYLWVGKGLSAIGQKLTLSHRQYLPAMLLKICEFSDPHLLPVAHGEKWEYLFVSHKRTKIMQKITW